MVWRRWAVAGPGLVFLAAAVGPQDVVSSAAAGVAHGYGFLWAIGLSALARYVFLETTARYVLATGESLIDGYARIGRWALWFLLGSVLIKRHSSNLYQLLLLGLTMSWILPLPFKHGEAVWSLFFWGAGFAVMYWGRYKAVERWCKPLVFLMGGALACVAMMAGPDPLKIVKGFLIPSMSGEAGVFSSAFVLMALVGSAAGSVSNLKYASFIHEKGWRDPSRLSEQRVDLIASAVGLLVMGALIEIAAAEVLQPAHATTSDPLALVNAFGSTLGYAGRIVMALGLWAAVITTYLGANTGYSLIVADVVANLAGRRETVSAGERPAYRWALIWFVVSPLYALFTDWSPIWLIMLASALQLVLMPAMAGLLLALTASGRRMGDLKNGLLTNAALVLMVVASTALIVQNVLEWL